MVSQSTQTKETPAGDVDGAGDVGVGYGLALGAAWRLCSPSRGLVRTSPS